MSATHPMTRGELYYLFGLYLSVDGPIPLTILIISKIEYPTMPS